MFYIFLADGFEEIEALCPYDLLLRAGIDVKTVSVNDTTAVTGTHNIVVHADMITDDISLDDDISGIMLPGGMPGASNLEANETVQAFLTKAANEDKLIAAICAAPYVLGNRGLLKDKEATCFPGFEGYLEGAYISDEKVVRDKNIITAKGMGAAFDLGIEMISYFKGEEFALGIKSKTQA